MDQRPESPSYQLFMLSLSVYTLMALAVETSLRLGRETSVVLEYADTAVCGVFLLDFLLSLRRAPNRWKYMYTWGWLDLASSIPAVGFARWGRIARVARLLRVLRAARATRILGQVVLQRRAESAFMAASLAAILLLVVASLSILQFEIAPESNIKTGEDAVWWALTTITTVGYGDRFPVTAEGRFIAALLMCAGVGLFGTFSGLLAAWFLAPDNDERSQEAEALRSELERLRTAVEHLTGSATPR